jgi:predicted phage terminase large subunit-like protein
LRRIRPQVQFQKVVMPDKREFIVQVPEDTADIDEDTLTASICRASFFEFFKEMWSAIINEKLDFNWHLEYLCNEMQKMAEGVFENRPKEYDLVVNISPGTTKSTIMSVMFTAWVWTRMPHAQICGASHTEDLAKELCMKARDLVMSERYKKLFPEIELRDDQNTKTHFKNTFGGFRYAVGVEGSVIGKHFHFIIIDDPVDPEGTESDAEMKIINRWITKTLITRKVNKAVGVTCLVMQRLHENDPTDTMLKRKRVKHICIPAELTEGVYPPELREKYVDGLMDPKRLPREVLKEYEDEGEYFYGSQFLQQPLGKSGNMFKVDRLKTGVPPQVFLSVVRYWDKAGTKDGGTWTVGTKIGKDVDGRFWVLDVQRFQLDSHEREVRIREVTEADGKAVTVVVEQEPGSGGKESAESTVRRLAGYTVLVDKVSASRGDKERRADPWSSQVNAGNVYLPEHAQWCSDWISEHKFFPMSKYKDQVDSAAGAFAYSHKKKKRAGALQSRAKEPMGF